MTLGEFKEMTKDMPDDIQMVMDVGDGVIASVCKENSRVLEMQLSNDEPLFEEDDDDDFYQNDFVDDEDIEILNVLFLVPCNCDHDIDEDEINAHPELN